MGIKEVVTIDKILLNVDELCDYLGLGKTKVRELLHSKNDFTIKIGNRIYAKKDLLDKHIDKCIKYNIPL